MALIDGIFSSIPGPLISQFGIDATYVKRSQNQTYNPNTGTVSSTSSEIQVKIIIQMLRSQEKEEMQESDVKIILSAVELGEYYPKVSDSIKYAQNGRMKFVDIISIDNYRGDLPIMHSLTGRVSRSEAIQVAPPVAQAPRLITIDGASITTLDGSYLVPI